MAEDDHEHNGEQQESEPERVTSPLAQPVDVAVPGAASATQKPGTQQAMIWKRNSVMNANDEDVSFPVEEDPFIDDEPIPVKNHSISEDQIQKNLGLRRQASFLRKASIMDSLDKYYEPEPMKKSGKVVASKESEMRQTRITKELEKMIVQMLESRDFEDETEMEPEARQALTKAAKDICYTRKYYDAANDEMIYLPSVVRAILDNSLFEKAEEYYHAENEEELPDSYTIGLRKVAFTQREEEGSNHDDSDGEEEEMEYRMMMELSQPVELSVPSADPAKKKKKKSQSMVLKDTRMDTSEDTLVWTRRISNVDPETSVEYAIEAEENMAAALAALQVYEQKQLPTTKKPTETEVKKPAAVTEEEVRQKLGMRRQASFLRKAAVLDSIVKNEAEENVLPPIAEPSDSSKKKTKATPSKLVDKRMDESEDTFVWTRSGQDIDNIQLGSFGPGQLPAFMEKEEPPAKKYAFTEEEVQQKLGMRRQASFIRKAAVLDAIVKNETEESVLPPIGESSVKKKKAHPSKLVDHRMESSEDTFVWTRSNQDMDDIQFGSFGPGQQPVLAKKQEASAKKPTVSEEVIKERLGLRREASTVRKAAILDSIGKWEPAGVDPLPENQNKEATIETAASADTNISADEKLTTPDTGKRPLSEAAMRQEMIKSELHGIVDEMMKSEDFEEEDEMEKEAYDALMKAAKEICYLRKYYDVSADEVLYFPSIIKTLVNYDLTEKAETYYREEDDEFPSLYATGLRQVAMDRPDAKGSDDNEELDDDMMERLSMPVPLTDDEPDALQEAGAVSEQTEDAEKENRNLDADQADEPATIMKEDEESDAKSKSDSSSSSSSDSSSSSSSSSSDSSSSTSASSKDIKPAPDTTEAAKKPLSEAAMRQEMIESELNGIVDEMMKSEDFEEEDEMEKEAYDAIMKAAKEICYLRKYYDISTDKVVYFPSVIKTLVNYDLTEKAETYYGDEEDEFPSLYGMGLRQVAFDRIEAEGGDDENEEMDDDMMERLSMPVQLTEDEPDPLEEAAAAAEHAEDEEKENRSRAVNADQAEQPEGEIIKKPLSEAAMRQEMIETELDGIIKEMMHSEDFPGEDEMEKESYDAIMKAAKEICYLKKIYDLSKDKVVYFPSVVKTIVNYDLIDAAGKYYYEEDDEFPSDYWMGLHQVAFARIEAEGGADNDDEMDDDMVDRLSMPVQLTEDQPDPLQEAAVQQAMKEAASEPAEAAKDKGQTAFGAGKEIAVAAASVVGLVVADAVGLFFTKVIFPTGMF